MSGAISGVGTKFKKWDGAAWVVVAEVNSISGPTMTKDFIDVTSLDSVGGFREFIGGFRDGGTISLTMNFVTAVYQELLDDFNADGAAGTLDWEINLPDGAAGALASTFFFKGIVTELPLEIPTDDKITSSVTIKVDGKVYYKAAPSAAAPVYE